MMLGATDLEAADTDSKEDQHAVVVPATFEFSLVDELERVAWSDSQAIAPGFQAGCGLKVVSGAVRHGG